MPSRNSPGSPIGQRKHGEDRATAAILAGGCADGVPSMALRYWSSHGGQETEMPVFITWLLGVGRFCLTVKYGRHSPERQGLVRRHRVGGAQCAVPAGRGPAGGDAGQPGPAAATAAQRAGLSGPGPPRHGAGPADRARWPAGAGSPCSGTWSAIPPCWPGRRPAPSSATRWGRPQALEEISALMDNSAHAGVGAVPRRIAPLPVRAGALSATFRRAFRLRGQRRRRFRGRMDRQLPQTFAWPVIFNACPAWIPTPGFSNRPGSAASWTCRHDTCTSI